MKLKLKKYIICVTIIIILVFVTTSCADNAAFEKFMNFLGFDTHDYLGEEVIALHEPDSEISVELAEMTRMLSISSPNIPVFSGTKEAASNSRDAILNYMLNTNYAKYTGNTSLLTAASEKYPQYHISTLIPAKDFENTVYKTFGGKEKITHKDGDIFKYLDKVEAYTSIGQPMQNEMEIIVIKCEESENTYRVTIKNKLDGKESPEYYILIIKRSDGTKYIKSIELK